MKCPTCNIPLVMTERSGIEIDYCPQCRGVWLDRGELDKIIERSSKTMSLKNHDNIPYQENRYTKEKEHYYKKKKGFFGDLFDF